MALVVASGMASAERQRQFGYSGQVDSFDRGSGLLVVDDRSFWLGDDTRVHGWKGRKGSLSGIHPGIKVGFYPDGVGRHIQVDEIWVLPSNWTVKREGPVRLGH